MRSIRSILVPTDFSSGAALATLHACELARRLGARITLLYVYQLPNYLFPDGSAYVAPPETLAELAREADRQLAELLKSLDAGVPVATQSACGHAAEEILRVAREGGYDLIVMGTHGRTGLKRFLLGSVAEQVVRHAACPVLTVRERPGAHAEAA